MATEKVVMSSGLGPAVSADQRKLIADALAMAIKSYERAAKANDGVIATAFEQKAHACRALANQVLYGQLDLS